MSGRWAHDAVASWSMSGFSDVRAPGGTPHRPLALSGNTRSGVYTRPLRHILMFVTVASQSELEPGLPGASARSTVGQVPRQCELRPPPTPLQLLSVAQAIADLRPTSVAHTLINFALDSIKARSATKITLDL
jgi:hypothetical protein